MKKIKFQKKLSLNKNKETIAKLNDEQMNQVKGGSRNSGDIKVRRRLSSRVRLSDLRKMLAQASED